MAKRRYATYSVFKSIRNFVGGTTENPYKWMDRTIEGEPKRRAFALVQGEKLAEIREELERTEDPEERWRIVKEAMAKAGAEYREKASKPEELKKLIDEATKRMEAETADLAAQIKKVGELIGRVEKEVHEAISSVRAAV
ncbi:hypothetical protein J7L60_01900 [Candidatus Bathyarchaeota archaeon]|nr:hypothetical protein [Candidatus Bathyarchaeota archaeon]